VIAANLDIPRMHGGLGRLTLSVQDPGLSFDPATVADPWVPRSLDTTEMAESASV